MKHMKNDNVDAFEAGNASVNFAGGIEEKEASEGEGAKVDKDDLISRKELLDEYDWLKKNTPEYNRPVIEEHIRRIQKAPAVDAEPVRHGSWKPIEEGANGHLMECTVCKTWIMHYYDYASDYCPQCGAKMDGDRNAAD